MDRKNNVKFLINDKPILSKKIGADGCHIGQQDLNIKKNCNFDILMTKKKEEINSDKRLALKTELEELEK